MFISISSVNGTLKNGAPANVSVPSNTLQISTPFSVESGQTVSFVYDVTVVQKGDHGYAILPQAGESGPDQPVNPIPRQRSDAANA